MDNSPISKEKLNFLNNLLDRELESLSNDRQPFQKSQPTHQDVEQHSFQQSSLRALSNPRELAQLQSKITDLESRIQKNIERQRESDEDTPLKNKYHHNVQSNTLNVQKKIQFNDIKQDERMNKFKLEKEIEDAENKLSQSRVAKRALNSSQAQSKSRDKSSRGNSQGNTSNNDVKLSTLRKQLDEEKSSLVKEKQKNQQLQAQIETLNKKLKKSQTQLEKTSTLEADYKRLLENFEKSEFIRQQQKTLIQSLKQELEESKHNSNKKKKKGSK